MGHTYTGASRAERDIAGGLLDKANALPSRGAHIGGGRHVIMPETWDGVGKVPPGWTSYQAHRNGDAAVWLPEPETATKLARLTLQEQAQLAAIRAAATPDAVEPAAEKESDARSR